MLSKPFLMKRILKLCLILLVCLFYLPLDGQVLINEFSASNLNSFKDSFNKAEDWIELYNDSDQAINIGGWHLSDKAFKEKKWEIPAGTIISAKGYLVFFCSGRDSVFNNEYHTNFKLTQTKSNEVVQLADPTGMVLDVQDVTLILVEHSICRDRNGSGDWKICTDPTIGSSNNASKKYNGYTVQPTIEKEAGFYQDSLIISINNNEPNSVLRFTIDGSNPNLRSAIYMEDIHIDRTTVVKALSFSNDSSILPGKMDFSTFFIDEDFSLQVFSVAADSVIDLAHGNGEIIPVGSLEYFNLDKEREAVAFGSLNRHGQDSWILPHRSLDWVTRDEMGYTKAVNAQLFNYSDRDEYQKFMFRNSGDDNYPAIRDGNHDGSTHIRDEYVQILALEGDMALDQRAVERVILFLNGEYWGLYGMRERPVDHDYTEYYYSQDKYDIQYLTTWWTTEIEYGGIKALND